ncbi:MAG TPA: hypothetical protein VLA36_06945 [Longimicrobiales bacterium]|nr:hypothetical protein [Longimicrobiales bacterium]
MRTTRRDRLTPSLAARVLLALAVLCLPTPGRAQAPANQTLDPAFLSAFTYRSVGPARGGRVTAVAGVADDPFLFYMGSTGGGVWRTDDAGESWRNITDGQFKVGTVGAITVAPSDANVIYVGTGSAEPRGNTSPGAGVYRSTDKGKTWTHIGLPDAGQVGKIVVHPKDPDVVFVAALGSLFGDNPERGVYRSRDGGANWEKVLFVSDSTGVVDIAMNPGNPRILYATAWRAQRLPWTMISGSMDGGLYRSKDGGDTWHKLSVGLPKGLFGKAGVTVSPANPERVWAIIEAEDEKGEGGVYRSDNGGDSWRKITGEKQLWHRPWYYMRITADPQDENTVWINNVLLYKSVDAGRTFIPVPTVPHADSHALWINPNNTDIMVEGDDGGATVTLNGGRSWSTQRNQATAELYRVAVDEQFPYRLYGAQQDNSTVSVPSKVPPSVISDFEQEYQVGGCESGHIAVDPRDPNIIYSGCYGGSINRYDLRTGQAREILAYPQNQMAQRIGDLRYRFQWNAPIRLSPHDPDILYHLSNHVHRSDNGGQSWEIISPDLTTDNPDHQGFAGGPITSDGTGVEVFGTIFAFEESPLERGVLWAGSDDGRVNVSRNNGETWTDVTPRGFPAGATVNSIDVSRSVPGRVHLAAYKYRRGDMRPYLFQTTDYGQTWRLLTTSTNGIPADEFARVVREDPERQGMLYAGTERGMYVSFDDGAHWQSFQRNLPVTPVTDIQVHHGDLVLSTQGRSFWIMDDITPLRGMGATALTQPALLHPIRSAVRAFFGGAALGAGPTGRRAQNGQDGALIHYSLAEDVEGPVTITITDAQGDTAATLSSEPQAGPDLGAFAALAELFGFTGGGALLPKTKGLHRANWNLLYPQPRLPTGTVIFGAISQPAAPPGTYTVTLSVGGEDQTQTLEVLADPRGSTRQADFIAQYQFLKQLGSVIEDVAARTDDLRSVRTQSRGLAQIAADAGIDEADVARVNAAADSLAGKLTAVEEDVQQTRSKSFYDPLDYPGKLTAELAFLYNTVAGGFGTVDAPPTDQAVARMGELQTQVDEVMGRLQTIFDTDLVNFNELIRSLGLDPVVLKKDDRNLIS